MRALTTLSIAGSAAVLWATLRKAYRTRAVALGITTALCGAKVVFDQLAQARFYGFFVLLTSIALATTFALARSDSPTRRVLVGAFASQVALVYCHLFGVIYSGALAGVIVLLDVTHRRFRPKVYAAFVGAWLAFIPWIPATLQQATLVRPRNWIPEPTVVDFIRLVDKESVWLPLTVVLIAGLATWEMRRRGNPSRQEIPASTREDRNALQLIGVALILVVVAVFVVSRLAIPVFIDRYLMPSVLGWAIVVTQLAQMTGEVEAKPGTPAGSRSLRSRLTLVNVCWSGYLLVIAVVPLLQARAAARQRPPRVEVSPALADAPIVVESALTFWPLHHYAVSGQRIVFPLDWPLALDSANAGASVQEYKLMRLYQERGYLGDDVQETSRVLCQFDRFIVVDEPDHLWLERRIASDSSYRVSELPTSKLGLVLRLVERRASNGRESCSPS
jgi:predicted small integral membrane protein